MKQQTRKLVFAGALALGAAVTLAEGWVADPYRAAGQSWPKYVVKGKDFWLMLEKGFLDKPGVSEEAFVRESGTQWVPIASDPLIQRFMRVIAIQDVTAVDANGKPHKARFTVTSDEPGATVHATSERTVLSAPISDVKVRYLPAKGRLCVRSDEPFTCLRIAHGSVNNSRIDAVSDTSAAAAVELSDRVCTLRFEKPVSEFSCTIASPRYTVRYLGLNESEAVRARLANAPFTLRTRVGIWNNLAAPDDLVDFSGLDRIYRDYPETCLGIEATEWDANFLQKVNHGATSRFINDLRATMRIPCGRDGMVANLYQQWKNYRNLNGPRMAGMSGGLNFQLMAADFGGTFACIETSGERVGASHRSMLLYTVSAGRQFGIPSSFYTAYFSGAAHPNSRTAYSSTNPNNGEDFGMCPSLGSRNFYSLYYMGGNYLSFESQPWGQIAANPDGKTYRLTENGRRMKDIFEWTKKPEGVRGEYYAPILLLEDRRTGDDQAHPLAVRKAAFYGLFDATDGDCMVEYFERALSSANGHEAITDPAGGTCHMNSSLGNIFQAYLANPLRHGDIECAQLAKYPVVMILGDLVWSADIANALKEYVAGGGTLVITAGQSAPFDDVFLGWKTGKGEVASDGLWLNDGRKMPNAKVLMETSDKRPLVVQSQYGAGCVDFVTSPFFKVVEKRPGDRYSARPKQMTEVLEALQAATLPFGVKGDCEFTVNRAADGSYKVLVFNNTGLSKNPRATAEKVHPEYATTVAFTLPKGAKAEEVRTGAEVKVEGEGEQRRASLTLMPGEIYVVNVTGIRAEAKPVVADPKFTPVSGFARRFTTAAKPFDGFRYDPDARAAEEAAKHQVPAMIGEWLAKNSFKDTSGNGNDLVLGKDIVIRDGVSVAEKGYTYASLSHAKAPYCCRQATYETWVKPVADPTKFASGGGRAQQGGVFRFMYEDSCIQVYYNAGKWTVSTMGGGRRADAICCAAKPEWTHLCVTMDGELNRFYVNGVEMIGEDGPIRTLGTQARDAFYNSMSLTYGSLEPAWGYHFRGEMAGLKAHSRCFSPDEVKELAAKRW